jgi:hypothetical protein
MGDDFEKPERIDKTIYQTPFLGRKNRSTLSFTKTEPKRNYYFVFVRIKFASVHNDVVNGDQAKNKS